MSSLPSSVGQGPMPLRVSQDRAARLALAAAMIANVLIWIRVSLLFNPAYSYIGPSGYDRVFYYAYTRSLVIDRDLDFSNEMALRPPSGDYLKDGGRILNKYPFGTALLALPAYAATHFGVLALNRSGLAHVPADGYSAPYVIAFSLSQMFWGVLGVWLLYRGVLRYHGPKVAAAGVIVAWFGTNAIFYTGVDLMMAHAAAIFSTAWCSYEAVKLRESPSRWKSWFRMGASAALVVMVRYQNAIYLLVPCGAAMTTLRRGRSDFPRKNVVSNFLLAAIGFLALFSVQMIIWKAVFGSWLTNTYGAEFEFNWWRPKVRELLTILAVWLPVFALGLAGCFAVAIRRKDLVAAAAGLGWLLNTYVASCWWDHTIASRSSSDMLFPICLGLASVFAPVEKRCPMATLAIVGALVLWYVPLVTIGINRPDSLLANWIINMRILIHM
jgi:hypothetical protein